MTIYFDFIGGRLIGHILRLYLYIPSALICMLLLVNLGIPVNKNTLAYAFPRVIYWPSTEPSIERCTCVNKRKNSGGRWALENNITRCLSGSSRLETVGDRMPAWEPACRLRALRPSVTHGWATQPRCERRTAMVEKELGSI